MCENRYFDDSLCDQWAANGDCETNPAWMMPRCRASCIGCRKPTGMSYHYNSHNVLAKYTVRSKKTINANLNFFLHELHILCLCVGWQHVRIALIRMIVFYGLMMAHVLLMYTSCCQTVHVPALAVTMTTLMLLSEYILCFATAATYNKYLVSLLIYVLILSFISPQARYWNPLPPRIF